MAVLLQYNRHDTLSLDELVSATAISKDLLTQVLALLVKAKLLVNEEQDQYDLNPGMSFRLCSLQFHVAELKLCVFRL